MKNAIRCVAALLAAFAATAQAQPALRINIGFAAGGSLDIAARAMAEGMREALGRPVIVENRLGAAGRIAVEATKTAKPDGDTLMIVPHGPMTLFPYVFKDLRFDPFRDFTPILQFCTLDYALTAGPAMPGRTLAEYRQWLQANAGKAAYASPGAGTIPHLIGVSLHQRLGIPATHVAYKGSALGLIDVMAGTVPVMFSPLPDTIEQHRNARVRILVTTGAQRTRVADGIPTLRESGIDFELTGWYAIYGPAGLPPATAQALTQAALAAVRMPAVQERLGRLGLTPTMVLPEEMQRVQKSEHAMWGPIVKASGFDPTD